MANTLQHKRGAATPTGGISRGELAIQEVSANYTTSSSSKLWIGEGATPTIRQVGFGVAGNSGQSGIPVGGNLTIAGGTDIDTTMSGTTLTVDYTGSGGSGDITGVTLASDSGSAEDLTANVNLTIGGGNAIGTTATGTTLTINHDDTSSQASVNNSGRTFIQDITLDTYGHITAITSATDADTYTGDITGVTAGTGLSGGGTSGTVSLALDFSELTDMTGGISGTTEFILQNGTTESRKAASEISLSNFNNNSGWTSNTGTTTASNSQTFTNKGGNISQWTNNSGYTTNSGTVTSVGISPGTGLDAGSAITSSGTISVSLDLSELTDGTSDIDSNDEVIYLDNGTEKRKAFSELKLSEFNNDSGWTANSGDITEVLAGTGMSGGGSSGSVSLAHAAHSGEVTGTTSLTIADNVVDEANLKVSNSPTNGYVLTARSGNTGGMTWEAASGGGSGTVTSVTAGTGMTQSGTSTINPTLNVIGGTGITANADNIALTNGLIADGSNITSLGTLTTLSVDDITINGEIVKDPSYQSSNFTAGSEPMYAVEATGSEMGNTTVQISLPTNAADGTKYEFICKGAGSMGMPPEMASYSGSVVFKCTTGNGSIHGNTSSEFTVATATGPGATDYQHCTAVYSDDFNTWFVTEEAMAA